MHVSVCLSVCLCACEAARAVKLPLTGCVAVRDTPSDVSLSLSLSLCVCVPALAYVPSHRPARFSTRMQEQCSDRSCPIGATEVSADYPLH